MTDLINDTPKGSPLLYLRDDKLKETLNNFFLVYTFLSMLYNF